VGPRYYEPRHGSDSRCCRLSSDTVLLTGWTNSGHPHPHPHHVHRGNGEDDAGHPGEAHLHRLGPRMRILNVWSIMGHSLSSCGFPILMGRREGEGRRQKNQEPDGGASGIRGSSS
jgi:hypothetical protein